MCRHVLAAHGNYLFPVSGAALARVIIGTGLLFGLAAVLALALGITLRLSAGAVVVGLVVLVLPFALGAVLPAAPADWLTRVTPGAAFAVQGLEPYSSLVANAYTPGNGYYPLAPWAGLGVLLGYAGSEWRRQLEEVGPMTAGMSVQATVDLRALPIGPWAGLGVVAAWAAAALLIGGALFRLRDG